MSALNVLFSANPEESLQVGQLAMHQGRIYFEYDPEFIKTGLELSPYLLPAKPGAIPAQPTPWNGLLGLFNDCLPDSWGLMLMDRYLQSLGVETRYLTPLDRLAYVGKRGMGALSYEPARDVGGEAFDIDIQAMANSAIDIHAGHVSQVLPQMARAGGSPGGARPKILVHLRERQMISGDRRIHIQTLGGLVDADYRLPPLDYIDRLKITQALTRNAADVERAFAIMVFNVLTHNRDDHSKNLSFLMDDRGEWHLSPAYDLTCSEGINGEHSTAIAGEGRRPTAAHIMTVGEAVGLKHAQMQQVIERVTVSISRWDSCCDRAGISQTRRNFPPGL